MTLQLPVAIAVLLSLPTGYFLISYAYLVYWHRTLWLWHTIIHENGRLTLLGSMFYFDHFVACVPMILLMALCTAGGFALTRRFPRQPDQRRARAIAATLFLGASLFILAAFLLSLYTVGWQRTADYALQRIERDGVLSKGGNWNQLQISNLPIALGAIALSSAVLMSGEGDEGTAKCNLVAGGILLIGIACVFSGGITAFNWCGWGAFLNPRWLGHSIREIATYPLTAIPIALASVALVEWVLSGSTTFAVKPRALSLILLGIAIALVIGQLLVVRSVNMLSIAQRPPFAPNGLSISYLLFSHVFEHFLDFVVIGPLAGGFYALVRLLSCRESESQ
jgi:hypothetical protein